MRHFEKWVTWKIRHFEKWAIVKLLASEIVFLVYLKNFEVTDFPNRPFLQ